MLEDWLDEHDGLEQPFAAMELGGGIPTQAEGRAMAERDQGQGEAGVTEVLHRLATVRSVLTIDAPGDPEAHPLLVSALRFLLRGAGPGLVRTDQVLQTTEQALANLADLPEAVDFAHLEADLEAFARGLRGVTVPVEAPPSRPSVDVPGLILDRLVADGLIALDPEGGRESLESALDRALASEEELSPVKALIEVLLDHDGVDEVFGADAQIEASMRRALEVVASR